MSIFINKNNQLIDTDFFGKRIKYKIPKWIKSTREKKLFNESHFIIKKWLRARTFEAIKTSEMQYMVSEYHESDPERQNQILSEGMYLKMDRKNKTPEIEHLIQLYRDYKERTSKHKTLQLNLAYLNTWELYINIKHTNGLHLSHVTRELLEDFVKWRHYYRKPNCSRKGLVSDATIKKEVSELRRCLEWCYTEEHTKEVPRIFKVKFTLPTLGVKQAVTPLTIEEQTELLQSLKKENPMHHDFILLLLITGMRVGELDTLSQSSFNLENGTIEVHKLSVANTISGGKTESAPRLIPLTPTLRELISRGYITQDMKTFKIGKNTYTKKLKGSRKGRVDSFIKYKRKEGILPSDFHLHRLRHSFVTNHLQAEKNPLEVSRRAGHAGVAITTDRYGKYLNLGIEQNKEKHLEHLKWLEEDYF